MRITSRPAPVLLWRLMCTMPHPRSCHLQLLAASPEAPPSGAAAAAAAAADPKDVPSASAPASPLLREAAGTAAGTAAGGAVTSAGGPDCFTNFHSLHSPRKTTPSSSSPVSPHSSCASSASSSPSSAEASASPEAATAAGPALEPRAELSAESAAGATGAAVAAGAGADEPAPPDAVATPEAPPLAAPPRLAAAAVKIPVLPDAGPEKSERPIKGFAALLSLVPSRPEAGAVEADEAKKPLPKPVAVAPKLVAALPALAPSLLVVLPPKLAAAAEKRLPPGAGPPRSERPMNGLPALPPLVLSDPTTGAVEADAPKKPPPAPPKMPPSPPPGAKPTAAGWPLASSLRSGASATRFVIRERLPNRGGRLLEPPSDYEGWRP
mmetsp:Transcript_43699/g.115270  ORF Transcript_43699/g.115270 Transcript_43699/m.115270 type:complete len:381 (-) Transcript_43699:2-1144(-)